jgi:hypothetical protein
MYTTIVAVSGDDSARDSVRCTVAENRPRESTSIGMLRQPHWGVVRTAPLMPSIPRPSAPTTVPVTRAQPNDVFPFAGWAQRTGPDTVGCSELKQADVPSMIGSASHRWFRVIR